MSGAACPVVCVGGQPCCLDGRRSHWLHVCDRAGCACHGRGASADMLAPIVDARPATPSTPPNAHGQKIAVRETGTLILTPTALAAWVVVLGRALTR